MVCSPLIQPGIKTEGFLSLLPFISNTDTVSTRTQITAAKTSELLHAMHTKVKDNI